MTAVTMMAQSQFECLRIDPIIKFAESAEPPNVMAAGKLGQTVKRPVFLVSAPRFSPLAALLPRNLAGPLHSQSIGMNPYSRLIGCLTWDDSVGNQVMADSLGRPGENEESLMAQPVTSDQRRSGGRRCSQHDGSQGMVPTRRSLLRGPGTAKTNPSACDTLRVAE